MNNVKEDTLLASTSQGETILLVSLPGPCFVLVWYKMRGSNFIKFSVLRDTLPPLPGYNIPGKFQNQHELCSVRATPYGRT